MTGQAREGPRFKLGQMVRLIKEPKRGPREFRVGSVVWNGQMGKFYYGLSDTSAWLYPEQELEKVRREEHPNAES